MTSARLRGNPSPPETNFAQTTGNCARTPGLDLPRSPRFGAKTVTCSRFVPDERIVVLRSIR